MMSGLLSLSELEEEDDKRAVSSMVSWLLSLSDLKKKDSISEMLDSSELLLELEEELELVSFVRQQAARGKIHQ